MLGHESDRVQKSIAGGTGGKARGLLETVFMGHVRHCDILRNVSPFVRPRKFFSVTLLRSANFIHLTKSRVTAILILRSCGKDRRGEFEAGYSNPVLAG